jgi:hypothetical protein
MTTLANNGKLFSIFKAVVKLVLRMNKYAEKIWETICSIWTFYSEIDTRLRVVNKE